MKQTLKFSSQPWFIMILVSALCSAFTDTTSAAGGRRSLSDLKDDEQKIRRKLEREGPKISGLANDRPFSGCLDAVSNPWEQCVRPAFEMIPTRQATSGRGEDFEGIQSYTLRYEDGGKIYYVGAVYVPREKRGDKDIAFLFSPPDEFVNIEDIGIPGAYYKPLPAPGSIFKAMATGEIIDDTGNSQRYEYYASLVIEFMCDGLSVSAGVDQVLPRNLGDKADAMARQLWQANMPQAREFAQRTARALRKNEVCVPGVNAIASVTKPDRISTENLSQGNIGAPMAQDLFDTSFREGYTRESASFGWVNRTVEEGQNMFSFPADTPGLER